MKQKVKLNALLQAQLIKLLMEGAYSCKELAGITGLHYVTVLQYCRELHKAKAVHICMWAKDHRGRDLTKIYKLGEGNDKRRQQMSAAERQARYRAKKKQMQLNQVLGSNAEFVDRGNGHVGYEELK